MLNMNSLFLPISATSHTGLYAYPDLNEICKVVLSMAPSKASRVDGIQVIVYQKQWNYVQANMMELVSSIFSQGSTMQHINKTLISLIPKPWLLKGSPSFFLLACAMLAIKLFQRLLCLACNNFFHSWLVKSKLVLCQVDR